MFLLSRFSSLKKRARYTFHNGFAAKLNKNAALYAKYCNRYAIRKYTVLYESHYGAGMLCNPYAIFCAFIKQPFFRKYQHVWVIDQEEERQRLQQKYREYGNVKFIGRLNKEYLKALATAKYLIQNTSFYSFFSKRPGQIYVNTWHSITVKTIGYDVADGNIQAGNMVRNFLQSDYIISANAFMTKIFRESFALQGIFTGKMIEEGHPRTDLGRQLDKKTVFTKLQQTGLSIDPSKKIILYAPTWRGKTVLNVEPNTKQYEDFMHGISQKINNHEYQILIKLHQYTYRNLTAQDQQSGQYVPPSIDTNELLSIVDILISDYSSIYFDYLTFDRPVLFYIPDLDQYQQDRGIYFKPEELPGPCTKEIDQLAEWINGIESVHAEYQDRRNQTRQWACKHDDGAVSERIINIVFRDQHDYRIHQNFSNKKKKLLFYAGGFAVNGVTTSLLSLLEYMDYDNFDVSLYGFKPSNTILFDKINKRARVLLHCSPGSMTRVEKLRETYTRRYGLNGVIAKMMFPKKYMKREYYRCFGSADFDYILDYSGYGAIVPLVLLQGNHAKSFIWQHTDLLFDLTNEDKRKLKQYQSNKVSIQGTTSLYDVYDKVVSCSQALMEINRENLSTDETKQKFTFVTNLIYGEKIQQGLLANHQEIYKNETYIIQEHMTEPNGKINIRLLPMHSPVSDRDDCYKFMTMGRLSPEKNHLNLLIAFRQLCDEHPNSRLYLIGDGSLKNTLNAQIETMNLQQHVIITGNMLNPFTLLRHCDCFVFPSYYEGQGLVILEARMLNLPIILSKYKAVDSVCVPNGQLLIGHEPEDIYQGMKQYIAGNVPAEYHFDVDEYNQKAYREFEALFE